MFQFQILKTILYGTILLFIPASSSTLYSMQSGDEQHPRRTRSLSAVRKTVDQPEGSKEFTQDSVKSAELKVSFEGFPRTGLIFSQVSIDETTLFSDQELALSPRLVKLNTTEVEPDMQCLLQQAQEFLLIYSENIMQIALTRGNLEGKKIRRSSLKKILSPRGKHQAIDSSQDILRSGEAITDAEPNSREHEASRDQAMSNIMQTIELIFNYLDDYFTKTSPKAFAALSKNKEIISIYSRLSFLEESPHTPSAQRTQFRILLTRLYDKVGFFLTRRAIDIPF